MTTTATELVGESRATQAAEKKATAIADVNVDLTSSSPLLAAASSDFAARGLAIVPQFLSRGEVEALREECDALVRAAAASNEADDFLVGRAGCVLQTLPRGSRGAAAAARGDSLGAAECRRAAPCTPRGAELALGGKLASLAGALLRKAAEAEEEEEEDDEHEVENGDERRAKNLARQLPPLVLIGEQYIVKPARGGPGTAFAWHADGSWLEAGRSEAGPREPEKKEKEKKEKKEKKKKKTSPQTYLSVWIPLDDVSPGNGGLVLPGEEEIERAAAARRRKRRSKNNLDETESENGDDEEDSPSSSSVPLVAAAGTAVAMASWLRHASGSNDSERPRRAWMPQLKLGPVEVDKHVEGEGEGDEEQEDREERRRWRERSAAAARETWRVPVPCSSFV